MPMNKRISSGTPYTFTYNAARQIGNSLYKRYKGRNRKVPSDSQMKNHGHEEIIQPSTYTKSSMVIQLYKVPKGIDYKTKWVLQDGRSGQASALSGIQESSTIITLATRDQILVQTATASVTPDQGQWPLFWMNPNQNITGNTGPALFNESNNSSLKQDSIYLDHIYMDFEFTNATSTATHVTLLYGTPKQSTSKDMRATWIQAVIDDSFGIGSEAFPATGGSTTQAQPGRMDINHPGSTPMDSKSFNKSWKIIGTKRFTIPQGGSTHKTSVMLKSHKKLNYQRIFNDVLQYQPGITIQCMLIQHGACVNDTLTQSGIYSECLTPWVAQSRYTLRNVKEGNGAQATRIGFNRVPYNAPTGNVKQIDLNDLANAVVKAN
jgi:hypothetical protein